MPKILIIEDDPMALKKMVTRLNGSVTALQAPNLKMAERLFLENKKDLDLIIMDSCVDGESPNVYPLLYKIRSSGFRWPIIASSSDIRYRRRLQDCGATHQSSKDEVPVLALKLLEQTK